MRGRQQTLAKPEATTIWTFRRDRNVRSTLDFAPEQPNATPEPNWLPTPRGKNDNLTFRFYGPKADLADGDYFRPPLIQSR